MIVGPRRLVLIGAIAAVALAIILLPLITIGTAPNLDKVTVELARVDVREVSAQNIRLNVVFTLANPTDQTATTSKIEYELFADSISLGQEMLSYEDIPPNGRPPIFSNRSVNLTSPFTLTYSDDRADIFNKITSASEIKWGVKGSAQIESAVTFITKEFSDEI